MCGETLLQVLNETRNQVFEDLLTHYAADFIDVNSLRGHCLFTVIISSHFKAIETVFRSCLFTKRRAVCLFAPAVYLLCIESFISLGRYEQQELDVSEELTSTTGCLGRDLNRRLFGHWPTTLPLSYPAIDCYPQIY